MTTLKEIVAFCDKRVNRQGIKDFPGAGNGLQFENKGEVTKIGASVDAGLEQFKKAIAAGVDFLIVHHGLFWQPVKGIHGVIYEKYKTLFEGSLAIYGSHLPLDGHADIGNNIMIARHLGLKPLTRCFGYEDFPIGFVVKAPKSREELNDRLKRLFPRSHMEIEKGSEYPERIAISSGSGAGVVEQMYDLGIDTLITGELRQYHYTMAEEYKWNLYPCGHYATEVFGVQELANEVAQEFNLEWEFIDSDCLL